MEWRVRLGLASAEENLNGDSDDPERLQERLRDYDKAAEFEPDIGVARCGRSQV